MGFSVARDVYVFIDLSNVALVDKESAKELRTERTARVCLQSKQCLSSKYRRFNLIKIIKRGLGGVWGGGDHRVY